MRAINPSDAAWIAFRDRSDTLRRLLREKRLILCDDDMPRASQELRALYPSIASVEGELNVLRRVVASSDLSDHGDGDCEGRAEYRFCAASSPRGEHRAEPTTDSTLKLQGYAVLWDDLSGDLGGFFERFARGAFSESLRDDTPKFFCLEHSPPPLASTATGDLALEENDNGLHFAAQLDKRDPAVAALEPLLRSGKLRSMSFGFRAVRDKWTMERGKVIRTVVEAKLLEISAVENPAYKQTSVAVAERSWQAAASERQSKLIQLANRVP